MFGFRNYSASELIELAKSEKPTAVNLILDQPTVDFLLGIRPENRPLDDDHVDEIAEEIEEVVLQTIGTIFVDDMQLTDGLHRLTAIKELGYPESFVARVVFGAGSKSLNDES